MTVHTASAATALALKSALPNAYRCAQSLARGRFGAYSLLLCAMVALLNPSTGWCTQLLWNGSFDTMGDGGYVVSGSTVFSQGWYISGPNAHGVSLNKESMFSAYPQWGPMTFHTAPGDALRLRAESNVTPINARGLAWQEVAVYPSSYYDASVWVFGYGAFGSDPGEYAELIIQEKNISGTVKRTYDHTNSTGMRTAVGNSWTRLRKTFTTTSTTATVLFKLDGLLNHYYATQPCHIVWDDALLDGQRKGFDFAVSGTVSSEGIPLSGATVTIGSSSTTTQSNGTYQMSLNRDSLPQTEIVASKAGYLSQRKWFNAIAVQNNLVNLDIVAVQGNNLLANGDFDTAVNVFTDVEQTGISEGWNYHAYPASSIYGKYVIMASEVALGLGYPQWGPTSLRSGNDAVRFRSFGLNGRIVLWQDVPALQSVFHSAKVWALGYSEGQGFGISTADYVKLQIEEYTSGGVLITSHEDVTTQANQWVKLSSAFTTAPNVAYLRFIVDTRLDETYLAGAAHVVIDTARLEAIPPVTISGRVTTGGSPLGDAIVEVAGGVAATNSNGNYSIAANVTGQQDVSVRASKYGYLSQEKTVHIQPNLTGIADFDLVSAGTPITIGLAKIQPDDTPIALVDKPVTCAFDGYFYVEEPNRSAGIKVLGNASRGSLATVFGRVSTISGEKTVVPTSLTTQAGATIPRPLGIGAKQLAGGLSPVGLYAKVWGRVDGTGPGWFTLNGGSGPRLKVIRSGGYLPNVGDYLRVVGALGSEQAGSTTVLVMRTTGVVPIIPSPQDSQWLMPRHDATAVGKSPLKGYITSPEIRWRQFVGARETLISAQFTGAGSSSVSLPVADMGAYDTTLQAWGIGGPYYDLDGTGATTAMPLNPQYRVGKFASTPGLQQVTCDTAFVTSTPRVHYYYRNNGQWVHQWQSDPIPDLYSANVIVDDFNNDGVMECACTAISYVYLLNLTNGAILDSCSFYQAGMESGRAYGWFGANDVNGDGKKELIIVADFQEHVDVMGWQNGKLTLLWSRVIEAKVSGKQSLLRPGPNPVADVDGDGLPEISISIYNQSGDKRWHTVVYNGANGAVKFDLPDECLAGIRDANRDGVSELFCTHASSSLIPDPAELSVVKIIGGTPTVIWQESGATFQTQPLNDAPASVNSGATNAWVTLLADPVSSNGNPVFFTRRTTDADAQIVQMNAWQADSFGLISYRGTVSGPNVEALAIRAEGGDGSRVLLRSRVPGDTVAQAQCGGVTAEAQASRVLAEPLSPVVIGRLAPGAQSIVVQGATEDIVAFQPGEGANTVLWRKLGRGMQSGYPLGGSVCTFGGVVLADLRGDGQLAAIIGTRGPQGQARLQVVEANGTERWHANFEEYPGRPPMAGTEPGLILWYVGHFTSTGHRDVLVNVRPSQDNILILLDGLTGQELWRRAKIAVIPTRGEGEVGCGGMPMSIYDYDGDGLDDALSSFYALITVFDGLSGNTLLNLDTTPGGAFGSVWTPGTYTIGTDLFGNGLRQILYWSTLCKTRAVLTSGGALSWIEPTSKSTYFVLPGIGDVDGDGKTEIVSPGDHVRSDESDQIVRCYNPATGAVKWELPLPISSAAVSSAVTADIDGDGKDECIFTVHTTLYAVGTSQDGRSGVVRWSIGLPGFLGPPAIADLEGYGSPQVVVTCSDGNVYGIGSRW